MPLLFPSPQTPSTVLASIPPETSPSNPFFLIFFASIDDSGRSWCGDCRAAEAPLALHVSEERSGLVYVGARNEWRDPSNPFRQAFGLVRIPTLVKVTSSPAAGLQFQAIKGSEQLIEGDILDEEKLKRFVGV